MKLSPPRNFFSSRRVNASRFILIAMAVVVAANPTNSVLADTYDQQIKQLQNEAGALQGRANELNIYGNTLQEAVNTLNAQIADLQAKIVANQAERDRLNAQIAQAEKDIEQRNQALKQNLKQMYIEGDVSNLEKVASSKSISDFVDKQEYRNKIRERIQEVVDTIKDLKVKNEKRKAEVEQLIKNNESLKAQVASQQAQQAALLAQTRGEEAAYQQQVSDRKARISKLYAQQAAAVAAATGGGKRNYGVIGSFQFKNIVRGGQCGGGYPAEYCLAGHDDVIDEFRLYNRECVSWAAWAAKYKYGRHVTSFGGAGHAYQWPDTTSSRMGANVNNAPAVGSVAIVPAGNGFPLGHAMVVESVGADGWLHVSQYNWDVNGTYSEMDIKATGLYFVHFR